MQKRFDFLEAAKNTTAMTGELDTKRRQVTPTGTKIPSMDINSVP